jgi:hypothetical protein
MKKVESELKSGKRSKKKTELNGRSASRRRMYVLDFSAM